MRDEIVGEGKGGGGGRDRERYFIFLHQQCNSLCFQVLTSVCEGREGAEGREGQIRNYKELDIIHTPSRGGIYF